MGDKLSVIGGSGLYTPLLFEAIVNNQPAIDFDEVCLNGRTESKLKLVTEVCQNLVEESEFDFEVSYTTDRKEALLDSDYVLTQIRVGGMKARAFDEEFPLEYDIIGEETVGPGGFANALRTVPVMLEIAREIEEYAPDSLVINLTNPASIVQQAIEEKTDVNIVSICDLPVGVINKMADLLETTSSELDVDYLGLNHLGWYTAVYQNGENKLEQVLTEVEKLDLGVDGALIRDLEAVPVPYLKYYYHPQQQVKQAKQKEQLRAKELLATGEKIREELAENPTEIPESIHQRGAIWYSDVIVPLIAALQNKEPRKFILNLPNDNLIPQLDEKVIIEVPAVVNSSGIRTLEVPDVPEQLTGILSQAANYRNLATKAAISQNKNDILVALMANPQVSSYDLANKLVAKLDGK
ncbi:MAG: glycosyl hydrolase family 4 [Bacillota bacterium]